jgi:Spy/CpxP family protein refolding chaperone
MKPLRTALSVVFLTAALGSVAVASAATEPANPNDAQNTGSMHHDGQDGPGGPGGGMHRILDQLDLTAEQTAAVTAIFAKAKPQMQAVHESGRASREQLETMPPTDPGYPRLVASAKANAAEQIQLMSDLWVQVYGKLTPDQRARIPGLVATQRAEWDSHRPGHDRPPPSR